MEYTACFDRGIHNFDNRLASTASEAILQCDLLSKERIFSIKGENSLMPLAEQYSR